MHMTGEHRRPVFILGEHLTPHTARHLVEREGAVRISHSVMWKMERSRTTLESAMATGTTLYGINTGFGKLATVRLSPEQGQQLQVNLVNSHACGVGEPLPEDVAALVLLLKAQNLALGFSGVRSLVLRYLITFFNERIVPLIPAVGSVGASGDLAPLAHLVLALRGEGTVIFRGQITSAVQALQAVGLSPLILHEKEGLALINGLQVSAAWAVKAVTESSRLLYAAHAVAAFSLAAFGCSVEPFSEELFVARTESHSSRSASLIRQLWTGTPSYSYVQDPYSFRCIPQVYGAVEQVVDFACQVVESEINSVSDNPLVVGDKVLSGGHFHGQALALAMDSLKIALVRLAYMSERRIDHLLSGERQLPAFLAREPGLNSGYMILQNTAVDLLTRMALHAQPASLHNTPTSRGQEDVVSMSTTAAQHATTITEMLWTLLACECLTALRALALRNERRKTLLHTARQLLDILPEPPDADASPTIAQTIAHTEKTLREWARKLDLSQVLRH